jgi:hypothetical protein
MERLNRNREIETLEAQLRKESYRYQLALKDGAVNSIVREVINRISHLEEELRLKKTQQVQVQVPHP